MSARAGVKETREVKVQVKKKKKKKKPTPKEPEIAQAEEAIERFDYVAAIPLLIKFLDSSPTHFAAQELLANALMESGHPQEALTVLQKCVADHPKKSYRVWMMLGQLQDARDALQSFHNGIRLMFEEKQRVQQKLTASAPSSMAPEGMSVESEAKQTTPQIRKLKGSLASIDRAISTAYTTLVELYTTTELSDEKDAESECEKFVKESIRISPTNPDAHYALANLRFIQEKLGEAESALTNCVKLIQKSKKDDASFTLKRSVATLAVELKQFQTGADFFELAIREHDTDPQLLYGAGFCYLNLGDAEPAIEYFTRAKEVLLKGSSEDPETKNLKSLVTNGMKQAKVLLSKSEMMDDSEAPAGKGKKGKEKTDDDVAMES